MPVSLTTTRGQLPLWTQKIGLKRILDASSSASSSARTILQPQKQNSHGKPSQKQRYSCPAHTLSQSPICNTPKAPIAIFVDRPPARRFSYWPEFVECLFLFDSQEPPIKWKEWPFSFSYPPHIGQGWASDWPNDTWVHRRTHICSISWNYHIRI